MKSAVKSLLLDGLGYSQRSMMREFTKNRSVDRLMPDLHSDFSSIIKRNCKRWTSLALLEKRSCKNRSLILFMKTKWIKKCRIIVWGMKNEENAQKCCLRIMRKMKPERIWTSALCGRSNEAKIGSPHHAEDKIEKNLYFRIVRKRKIVQIGFSASCGIENRQDLNFRIMRKSKLDRNNPQKDAELEILNQVIFRRICQSCLIVGIIKIDRSWWEISIFPSAPTNQDDRSQEIRCLYLIKMKNESDRSKRKSSYHKTREKALPSNHGIEENEESCEMGSKEKIQKISGRSVNQSQNQKSASTCSWSTGIMIQSWEDDF